MPKLNREKTDVEIIHNDETWTVLDCDVRVSGELPNLMVMVLKNGHEILKQEVLINSEDDTIYVECPMRYWLTSD